MSNHNITRRYLRLRTITALTFIVLAAIVTHLVGHVSQTHVAQKAAVTAALDQA